MSQSDQRWEEKPQPKELTDAELWGDEIKPLTPEGRRKLEEQGQMRIQWDS